MKINGRTYNQLREDYVVFPRPDGDIVLKLRPVLDDEKHLQLDPVPAPPKVHLPNGQTKSNPEDREYLELLGQWSSRKTHWYFIETLRSSENLEWETVKYDEPLTWPNWVKEMREAQFNENEISYLMSKIIDINCLNQKALDEARERFLAKMGSQQA